MGRIGYRKFHGFKKPVFGKSVPKKYLLDYAQARELSGEFTTLVEDGGIGLLIGEVGIGKTTAIRAFKEELGERSCRVCYVGSVKHSTAVLQEFVFQMGYQPSHQRASLLRQLSKAISQTWLEHRKKTLLVLDDAQVTDESLLEDLRLLSNFEIDSSEPLILLLVGHPSLQNRLRKPVHLALWDRLRMLFRLEGLSLEDTHQYIEQHLKAASGPTELFTPEARVAIFEHSQGIPRRINRLALEAVKRSTRNKVKSIDETMISVAARVFDGV